MKDHKEAIWLILLAAVLLLLISKMHGEAPRRYEKRVHRRIFSAYGRLQEMDRWASFDQAQALYLNRGYLDVGLCFDGLPWYRKGRIPKSEMEHLLKQLDRDMEDFPPQATK